ncbi:MAG: hypothetical protein GX629_10335 [Phycisphaerae bacterium]|jgi:hypothetical protein|nr:hypothetical protein [Phycisphaerae bacterium]
MKNYLIIGLIVLNVVLVGTLAVGLLNIPQANAQPIPLSGNFLMVSGAILGSKSDIVYVIDLENRRLLALYYDRASEKTSSVGTRDLIRDLGSEPEGSRRRVPIRPR